MEWYIENILCLQDDDIIDLKAHKEPNSMYTKVVCKIIKILNNVSKI